MFYNIKTKNQGKEGGERIESVHLIIYIRARENGRYERGRFFNYRENSFSRQGRKVSYVGKIIGIENTNKKRKFSEWDRINSDKVWPSRKKSLFLQTKLR